jgi:hypothetical protein
MIRESREEPAFLSSFKPEDHQLGGLQAIRYPPARLVADLSDRVIPRAQAHGDEALTNALWRLEDAFARLGHEGPRNGRLLTYGRLLELLQVVNSGDYQC